MTFYSSIRQELPTNTVDTANNGLFQNRTNESGWKHAQWT